MSATTKAGYQSWGQEFRAERVSGNHRGDLVHLIQYRQAMAVVRLTPDAPDPDWAKGEPMVSITRTADETSVFCPTDCLPEPIPGPFEGPFTVTRAAGQLEFTQIGLLLKLLRPLADAGLPVLTVSTFDTDWILVPAAQSQVATSVWRHAGHTVTENAE